MGMSSLSSTQVEIMSSFYAGDFVTVPFAKAQRRLIELNFKKTRKIDTNLNLENKCPAFRAEMEKVLLSKKNIQGAVFSECAYAQGLAQAFILKHFVDPSKEDFEFDDFMSKVIHENNLSVRYIYANHDHTKVLVQAGGNNGVDCALIDSGSQSYWTIELKEAYSKTPEPDLPKYSEDGKLFVTKDFLVRYPQFASMLEDTFARELNYFVHAGRNFNKFSKSSIEIAANESYVGTKSADVVCTEDNDGFLVMLPANQVGIWADLEGEIRPAGRNRYAVWTPKWFLNYIYELGGDVNGNQVRVPASKLKGINQRGGTKASGYKIGSLFYIKGSNCNIIEGFIHFSLENVQQLNPTIAVKMNFKKINRTQVRAIYFGDK
jgi:hypothetical protein